jgi:hypothetical protein
VNDPRVVVCTLALGGWYPRGVSRLLQSFEEHCHGIEVKAWVNSLPPGAPENVVEDGHDYTAYSAKPFAIEHARVRGADIVIWLDASFKAIGHIQPLIDHIGDKGYYLCKNGWFVGNWSSDRCLAQMGHSRREAMGIEEVASGCVGLDLRRIRELQMLRLWMRFAHERLCIPGHHTNSCANRFPAGRHNVGFVSNDPNVWGHRHDQTVLSLIAHDLEMTELVARPKFWSYSGETTEESVLLCKGM